MQLHEMDEQVTYMQQLQEPGGPVVLINQFNVAPEDADRFLEVWANDASFMKRQPGFISTQLHRGTAGSTTFMNMAVWESAEALGKAFHAPTSRNTPRNTQTALSRRRTSSKGSRSPGSASPSARPGNGDADRVPYSRLSVTLSGRRLIRRTCSPTRRGRAGSEWG
jgi:heme-degrading monooxygenase HmoA